MSGSQGRIAGTLQHGKDPRLLRLFPQDNVLIVGIQIGKGETYVVDDVELTAAIDLTVGSKVAFVELQPDDIVLRLGVPIGKITQPVAKGDLVHSHNLVSQRQRSTTRIEVARA